MPRHRKKPRQSQSGGHCLFDAFVNALSNSGKALPSRMEYDTFYRKIYAPKLKSTGAFTRVNEVPHDYPGACGVLLYDVMNEEWGT